MSKYIVVVDYNLSRFYDVKMMAEYAKSKYSVDTILIKPNPQECDRNITSIILDLDPRSSQFISKSIDFLKKYRTDILAVMPFSDNSVSTGARLAEELDLKTDSSTLAMNAYSKIEYRKAESYLRDYLEKQNIFVPKSKVITTKTELFEFAQSCLNGFVLKPSCEGNNRGVLKLTSASDLDEAYSEVQMYLNEGLICEEMIPFSEEYSFDGIGNLFFFTEKMSVNGKYPVEKGQIVPARKSALILNSIERAGRAANLIVGQQIGPFHNEVKIDPNTQTSAVIEPNRRPAGMKIWHLAEKVYGINFFQLWVDQLMGKPLISSLPQPKGLAGIIQLSSPMTCFLPSSIDDTDFAESLFNDVKSRVGGNFQWTDFKFTQKSGTLVSTVPKDNSGFIAEVCFFSNDLYSDVGKVTKEFEQVFKEQLSKDLNFAEVDYV